jgi:hypothetical protein
LISILASEIIKCHADSLIECVCVQTDVPRKEAQIDYLRSISRGQALLWLLASASIEIHPVHQRPIYMPEYMFGVKHMKSQ